MDFDDFQDIEKLNQEGMVEVFHEGLWVPLSAQEWTLREGNVVCEELGFNLATKVDVKSDEKHCEKPTYHVNYCSGNEDSIMNCKQVNKASP